MSVNRNRVHEVAAFLEGTCGSLDDVTTEAERDDMEFLRELDEQVFCCDSCGWWFAVEESFEGDICYDCYADGNR